VNSLSRNVENGVQEFVFEMLVLNDYVFVFFLFIMLIVWYIVDY